MLSLLRSGIETGAASELELLNCTYAVACDDPANLAPIQLIAHFDSLEGNLIAPVHYLCAPPVAEIAFFRHRRTGFERIDATRLAPWQQALSADARQFGLPTSVYHAGSSQAFEQIGIAPLRFNRLIADPANCLHSGMLDAAKLSNDPAFGRLTITTLARWIWSLFHSHRVGANSLIHPATRAWHTIVARFSSGPVPVRFNVTETDSRR